MRLMRPLITAAAVAFALPALSQTDPLPSWNDGDSKAAIIAFVDGVTTEGGDDFVAVADRVAVFDNDGTLWAEKPAYVQLYFAIDRVKALAPQHPDWTTTEPFASILKGDIDKAFAGGHKAIAEVIGATHSGMTTEEFNSTVLDWITTAKNPETGRPVLDMVYQPMLELLAYLRANGFQTFVVSGGGIDFMRAFTEQAYGIPNPQIVGSSGKLKFDIVDGKPELLKEPDVDFIDDGPGKPVGIQMHIGKQPIAAFGNSDGDLQMLQYTCITDGPRFCAFVHHTDGTREWAYDKDSNVGQLDEGLSAASTYGWTLFDMAKDWKVVFPGTQ
ncbi:HAD family hydrolase [Marinibacterium profundimaris]|uniref:Haloacid dehalogenase n=1 Tax=Marinibacterium profundimaris TaxID=1679460 RepID=A0A225NLR7_9RHOB|nr:HAD family hydrolase [Marinibacterium profundimaris]OWU73418.1 haloacid dehalogenase [Marinibacterium profundimaris]